MQMCPRCGGVYRPGARHCMRDGARLRPAAELDPRLGSQVGNFRLTGVLGSGGMGVVYRAEHLFIPKQAAIKILHDKWKTEAELVTRFFKEALAATTIGHPHIVEVSDFGELADGCSYFVMELCDGRALDVVIEEEGAMPFARASTIGQQIASALAAAHDKRIIHRDLKPANVVTMARDGADFVKVLDFGVARMMNAPAVHTTKPGTILGTAQYMAPEIVRGEPADARSDIYSLGVLLYELLVGQVPFDGATLTGILRAQVSKAPPPIKKVNPRADVTSAVEWLIMRCLDKDPAQRPPTMRHLAAGLEHARAASTASLERIDAAPAGDPSGQFIRTLKGVGSEPPASKPKPRRPK